MAIPRRSAKAVADMWLWGIFHSSHNILTTCLPRGKPPFNIEHAFFDVYDIFSMSALEGPGQEPPIF